MDLHANQLQGFLISVDHLTAEPVIVKYLRTKQIKDLTVVAPDVGNMKTASRYATALGADLATIYKRRINGCEVACGEIIGQVKGRNIVMCDDMITTGGTICGAVDLLRKRGAGRIIAGATHGVLTEQGIERIQKADLDEVSDRYSADRRQGGAAEPSCSCGRTCWARRFGGSSEPVRQRHI